MNKNDNERNERFITSAKKTIPPMSNNQLPAEVQERIKTDTERSIGDQCEVLPLNETYMEGYEEGYVAGATAMAQNIQQAIAIMQEVIKISDRKHDAWDRAKDFIQQWKEGKEVVITEAQAEQPVREMDDRNEFAEWCRMQHNYGFIRGMGWKCEITHELFSTDFMYNLFKEQKEK